MCIRLLGPGIAEGGDLARKLYHTRKKNVGTTLSRPYKSSHN